MKSLLDLFVSSSISTPPLPQSSEPDEISLNMGSAAGPFLHNLPPEIIHQIFSLLPPYALVNLSQTSHLLRTHAQDDPLWTNFVQENCPGRLPVPTPGPCQTWKDLYIAHHPYWFLSKYKIWFSDQQYYGKVIISRYDPRRGCIDAYSLVAEHGARHTEIWEWNRDVEIHSFSPKVRLWLDDPVIQLNVDSQASGKRLQKEVLMHTGTGNGKGSELFLCQPIPISRQDRSMHLWPPTKIPATHRVRNDSPSQFQDPRYKPRTWGEASDTTFRIRRWIDIRAPGIGPRMGTMMGEQVSTYSTLPEEAYTPTKEKPWQGIWVGDYSGHGCEFLLVQHRPKSNQTVTSSSWVNWLQGTPMLAHFTTHAVEDVEGGVNETCPSHTTDTLDESPYMGRLEAIKLTGDPNVPCGEYSWIAEDIGSAGLLRIADEKVFRGSRVVRSWGHIAERRYLNGEIIYAEFS